MSGPNSVLNEDNGLNSAQLHLYTPLTSVKLLWIQIDVSESKICSNEVTQEKNEGRIWTEKYLTIIADDVQAIKQFDFQTTP